MKIITMTELRASPGEHIIDVIRDRASFTITKGGKPVAMIVQSNSAWPALRAMRLPCTAAPGKVASANFGNSEPSLLNRVATLASGEL